jgi:regulator of RNase E activity RraA
LEAATNEIIDGFKELDSATVFNAVVQHLGGWKPASGPDALGNQPDYYTGPEMRCLLPELGCAVGYAVTAELTTNDPDSAGIPWDEYYQALEDAESPIIAVLKDVDSRPGRGACFGDGMAARHISLGATGAVVEGSVRDLAGIGGLGFPVWGTGLVPGHGVFTMLRINIPVTVAQLRVLPGELLIADTDGCTRVPSGLDLAEILRLARGIRDREAEAGLKPSGR